ncbi:MAG: sensor histidine kinase [Saprospiraceae bacterium]
MIKELKAKLSGKEVLLFFAFYYVSTMVHYTATYISYRSKYGANGHPSYFNIEEFFAAAGTLFFCSLLVTIPIWYVVVLRLSKYGLRIMLLSHLIFLPIYIFSSYYLQLEVLGIFGWVTYFGGYLTVWDYYMKILFYVVQFGLIHAFIYHKKYRQELLEKASLREAVLQSEITALKAQLNPHFLHNLFNSINASIPPENERTRELIIQLSNLFRYQNKASQSTFVTIEEELQFIKDYLDLMKVRLKDRLQVSYEIESACLAKLIPPMILQPIVENSITHGIAPKVGKSELKIMVFMQAEKVHFKIADTGLGVQRFEELAQAGLGLSNTKLRLQKMYGTEIQFAHNQPTGLIVSFSL